MIDSTILIALIVAVVLIVVLAGAAYVALLNSKIKRLKPQIIEATDQFNGLSDFKRRFTQEECRDFKTKHGELYKQSKQAGESTLILNKTLKETGTAGFVQLYDNADSVCRYNNEIRERVDKVENTLEDCIKEFRKLMVDGYYFAHIDIVGFEKNYEGLISELNALEKDGLLSLLKDEQLVVDFHDVIRQLNDKIKCLKPKIDDATVQFNGLSDLRRRFTQEECKDYKTEHKDLYIQSKQAGESRLIKNETKKEAGIAEFVQLYDNAENVCRYNNEIRDRVEKADDMLDVCVNEFRALMADDHYFAHSERVDFETDCEGLIPELKALEKDGLMNLLKDEQTARSFSNEIKDLEKKRQKHNNEFVKQELKTNEHFFDTVLAYPLDYQQRESIVKLEDNCLVVASAGSGKTSTMMGKIKYLTQIRKEDPEGILTISYTRKAAEELSGRLNNNRLRCLTFHKLAIDIIGQVSGRKPSIADPSLFVTVFYQQLKNDTFKEAVVNYLIDYQNCAGNMLDYDTTQQYVEDRRKYGNQSMFPDVDGNIVFTKSEEEKKIISYLTKMGVMFRYENNYPQAVYDSQYRQYKPDFTIYWQEKDEAGKLQWKMVYLEHYGIDENGNVPKWFGNGTKASYERANEHYHEGIQWKEGIHKENHTILIFTTSADFKRGNAEQILEQKLRAVGVPIKRRSNDELYNMIVKRSKSVEKSVMNLTQSFMMLMKANQHTIAWAKEQAQQSNNKMRELYLIDNLMKPLFEAYQMELAKRQEQDFTDVILEATELCENGRWRGYNHILVDEFQDISTDRYRFLLALRNCGSKPAKLYCVGDDWQSIYRFSGSDMSLFGQFADYFGYTEECKIETTYRFGYPLIGVSSNFIQQNPIQKKKTVNPLMIANPAYQEWKQRHQEGEKAPDMMIPKNTTEIGYLAYANDDQIYDTIQGKLEIIPNSIKVYILGRYSYDVNVLGAEHLKVDNGTGDVTVKFKNREVRYLTAHSSKGLEADVVFLLNCNSGMYGFPSQVADDPILEHVLSQAENFDFGEERRLFYVAITRAKKKTYVMFNVNKPSVFVQELTDVDPDNKNVCPVCKSGKQRVLYGGVSKTGSQYKVWGCNNNSYGCPYYNREFWKV